MTEVKISVNPISSNIEVVENFMMMSHVPASDHGVTVKIDSNIQEYIENDDKPGVQVRQVTFMTDTKHTKTLEFNFTDKQIQSIEIDNRNFEIKLIEIGNEEVAGINGQKFKFYKFTVDEK